MTTFLYTLLLLTSMSAGVAPPSGLPASAPQTIPSVAPSTPRILVLKIVPASVLLNAASARQRLVITAAYADGSRRDVTRQAVLSMAPSGRAVIEDAVLKPRSDGISTVTAVFGGIQASATVTVHGAHTFSPVDFANDLVPMFTRNGCNQGMCHGSASGRGGFHLSLRGFDPDFDYEQIVKDAGGHRVDSTHPEQSLVLRKPSAEVSHGGGPRFVKDSQERALLVRWLREGMKKPDGKVRMTELIVSPVERVLDRAGSSQQILVTARYSDGSARDVTEMARYQSGDDGVATVDDNGLVTAKRGGEAAIMVAYGGFVEAPRIVVPVGETPVAASELLPNNFVDKAVYSRLAALRIHPSGLCTDSEFLRRVTLDLTGALPTDDEAVAFLRDPRPDKRAYAIDRLLDSPPFVDFRTLKLADMLRVNSTYIGDEGVEAYYRWIHRQVEENVPWDKFVRSLLTARGRGYTDGAANYYRVATEPPELAEATAQAFLGIRIQCARCHNHPFERWTQNDYYSLAAFFARVTRKDGPEFGENQVVLRSSGEVEHPKTHKPMEPRLLGGRSRPIPPETDRRAVLAEGLTAASNVQFSREAVNRVWFDLFGKGIVDPVDDMRVSNPPSNAPLLNALAEEFVRHQYDIKWLYRTIANSRTYQLSSVPTATNLLDTRHFARSLPRRLAAEQALDALCAVTGVKSGFGSRPAGTLAIQVTGRADDYFLQVFGKPKREIVCTCERDMQPNLAQSLHLINSGDVDGKLTTRSGWLRRQIAANALDADIVTGLYLRALSRYPTDAELKTAMDQIYSNTSVEKPGNSTSDSHALRMPPALRASITSKTPEPTAKEPPGKISPEQRRAGLEDVAWAVLNSEEYLFNH